MGSGELVVLVSLANSLGQQQLTCVSPRGILVRLALFL